jgi:hypothetical protein
LSGTDTGPHHDDQRPLPATVMADPRRSSLWIYALVALLACGMVAFVTTFLLASRNDLLARESRELARWATMLADSVQRVIFDTDLLSAALEERLSQSNVRTQEDFRRVASTRQMHEWMRETVLVTSGADAIALIDAGGEFLNSSRLFPAPPLNFSDRPYFATFRERPDIPFVITEPLRSRVIAVDAMFLVRRVAGPAGEFIGVIHTTIPTARMTRVIDNTFAGEPITVSLQRRDGPVLLRYPEAGSIGAADPEVQRFFRETLARADSGTLHVKQADAEGGPRLLAIQALRGYPLVVSLSMPESAVLAAWQQQARLMTALAAGAVLLVLGLG